MSDSESSCFFSLSPQRRGERIVSRIQTAPLPESVSADRHEAVQALGDISLCDRDACLFTVTGLIKAGYVQEVAPERVPVRDAELALLLPADCVWFQHGKR